jgi:hypothetical protein
MPLRTASRVDANQAAIVRSLRGIGCLVLHLHQLKNYFDLLVGYRGRTFLMEIQVSPTEKLTAGVAPSITSSTPSTKPLRLSPVHPNACRAPRACLIPADNPCRVA